MSMWTEEASVTAIETKYMTRQRRNTVIVLEELDFVWDEDEITEYCQMWREGKPFSEIAEWFGRDPDEVLLLHLHLARKGRVKARKGGLMGC